MTDFHSIALGDTPLAALLHVPFCHWQVERMFLESKTEVGLDHHEGRTWLGSIRHLVLTGASVLYLAEQRKRTRRLRGGTALTIEQVRPATEVQMEPGLLSCERRRRLARTPEISRYHQRRNEVARGHTKTRLRLLATKGIDPAAIERCPVAL